MHRLDMTDPVTMNVEEIGFEIMGLVKLAPSGFKLTFFMKIIFHIYIHTCEKFLEQLNLY
jgi:hypothetical protein